MSKHDIEFDYERNAVASDLTVPALLRWISDLHSELTNAGVLPDGVSTDTHLQLMALANTADALED